MRALLIVIVVLVIAVIVGDRVAVVMAQNEIARKIAADYNLPHQPSVNIGGYPFLNQAADGNYDNIKIRIGDWSEQNLSVHNLNITLTDVSAPLSDLLNNRTSNLVAQTATATAVVPYDIVQTYAPPEVESIANSPDGLSVTGTFSVEGIPIPVPATVVVTVIPSTDGIEVTPVSARAKAGGPTIPLSLLRQTLTFTVPLQRLPLGARLTAIEPTADGLQVTAVAQTVRFSDLP